MDINIKICITKNNDPYHNLAIEEYLLRNVKPDECIMYLWQNQNTVVIGRNQNPWRECRTELLDKEGGKLARRTTGGGAVFHDLGNLNFSFVTGKDIYDLKKQLSVIVSAANKLGINAGFSGRNDILVNGKKFSGNAFCFRKNSSLHHGTILIDEDMTKLSKYLSVSKEKMESKGVKSVQSRVTNLIEYNKDLTVDKMIETLKKSFCEIYNSSYAADIKEEDFNSKDLQKIIDQFSSWEWKFGESPRFDVEFSTKFNWGEVQLGFSLKDAKIIKTKIYSDAMDEAFIRSIPETLDGCNFQSAKITERLLKIEGSQDVLNMASDIAKWISSMNL